MRRFGFATLCAAILVWAAGCQGGSHDHSKAKGGTGDKDKGGHAHAHDHAEEGPHKGALAEWGEEEYHAEFTVNHETKEATVYILDGKAKNPAPIKATKITLTLKQTPAVTVTLMAKPQEGDPAGSASRFVGTNDAFAKEKEFEGTISAELDGKPYAGTFKEKSHAGHDHGKK